MTGQPSPSPPPQSCGRAAADHQETGYRSRGALKGTGWWTSCAGRSAAVRPTEKWTGTGQERETPESYTVLHLQLILERGCVGTDPLKIGSEKGFKTN